MRRLLVGIVIGVGAAAAAHGAMRPDSPQLREVTIAEGEETALAIPRAYGRLAGVAVTSDIHHLYFEDAGGSIRIVRIGPSSAGQRGKYETRLLSEDVYLIPRDQAPVE